MRLFGRAFPSASAIVAQVAGARLSRSLAPLGVDGRLRVPESSKSRITVVGVWSLIERSYTQLATEEKKQVEVEAEPDGKDVMFSGFYMNEKSRITVSLIS